MRAKRNQLGMDSSSGSRIPAQVGIWRCDRDEWPANAGGRVGDEDGDVDDGGARAVVLVREYE